MSSQTINAIHCIGQWPGNAENWSRGALFHTHVLSTHAGQLPGTGRTCLSCLIEPPGGFLGFPTTGFGPFLSIGPLKTLKIPKYVTFCDYMWLIFIETN